MTSLLGPSPVFLSTSNQILLQGPKQDIDNVNNSEVQAIVNYVTDSMQLGLKDLGQVAQGKLKKFFN
jgi:hypothetical protein